MKNGYFTDYVDIEDIAEMTEKMLKLEKAAGSRNIKAHLLRIIPAIAAVVLVISLANLIGIIDTGIFNWGTNSGDESDAEYITPGKYVAGEFSNVMDYAVVYLNDDNTFTFMMNMLSSYAGTGTYSIENGNLILSVNDDEKYIFEISGGQLIYQGGTGAVIDAERWVKKGTIFILNTAAEPNPLMDSLGYTNESLEIIRRNKTSDVYDIEKLGVIVTRLPMPWKSYSYEMFFIESDDDGSNILVICYRYDEQNPLGDYWSNPFADAIYQNNRLLLFASIDNLDKISFHVGDFDSYSMAGIKHTRGDESNYFGGIPSIDDLDEIYSKLSKNLKADEEYFAKAHRYYLGDEPDKITYRLGEDPYIVETPNGLTVYIYEEVGKTYVKRGEGFEVYAGQPEALEEIAVPPPAPQMDAPPPAPVIDREGWTVSNPGVTAMFYFSNQNGVLSLYATRTVDKLSESYGFQETYDDIILKFGTPTSEKMVDGGKLYVSYLLGKGRPDEPDEPKKYAYYIFEGQKMTESGWRFGDDYSALNLDYAEAAAVLNNKLTTETARELLGKYLPAVIFDNMPDFTESIGEDSTMWRWSAWDEEEDLFLHQIAFAVDNNNILASYQYHKYHFDGIPEKNITMEQASDLVKSFAADFIHDGGNLHFENKPTYYSLHAPGVIESWVAWRGVTEYIVMVNLVYGYVEYYWAGAHESELRQMTLDDVRNLAVKGEDLFWTDVAFVFEGHDPLSGLYGWQCDIDDNFVFLAMSSDGYTLAGALLQDKNKADNNQIDIRYYDVEAFIQDGLSVLLQENKGLAPTPAVFPEEQYSYYPVFDKIEKISAGSDYEPEKQVIFMLSDEERAEFWELMRIDEWVIAAELPLDLSASPSEFSIHEKGMNAEHGAAQSWAFRKWGGQTLISPSLPDKDSKKICYFAPADVLSEITAFTESLVPFSGE